MAFRIDFDKSYSYAGPDDSIVLPVVLQVRKERVDFLASVDTGASHCLFQRSYADALGLHLERGIHKVFTTANSRFEAFGHEVTMRTLEIDLHSLVFFFIDAGILKNVLGRRGWLDRLRVGIVDHDQLVYVAGYDAFQSG